MEKLIRIKMSRQGWGYVLFYGALISLLAAFVLDRLGLKSAHMAPLPFVGAVVFLKLGLFGFWPVFAKAGRKSPLALGLPVSGGSGPKEERIRSLALHDPRVDGSVFQHNVPTFVLNHEQRFLDWNAAFELVFGGAGLARNGHVSTWFDLLDNYKRVSKRQEKLFGEGILPLTDRERATFVSPRFGRMVFTKIMTPIIDRRTGKILGWNVVLNVNSVTKREEFFAALYAVLAKETRRVRYAAAQGGLFKAYPAYRKLMAAHLAAVGDGTCMRVLEIGASAGMLTRKLLKDGHRVTALDQETEILRTLRDRSAAYAGTLKLVRRDLAGVQDLPAARFDRVSLTLSAHKVPDLGPLLASAHAALACGGRLALSSLVEGATIAALFEHLRLSLERAGAYEELKHQLNHVQEWEQELAADGPFAPRSLAALTQAAEAAGFVVESAEQGHLGGHAVLLVARKP